MADTKVRVEVETTANVSGLKQVQAELAGVEAATVKLSTAQQAMADKYGFWLDAKGKVHKVVEEVEQVAAATGKVAAATGAAAAEANVLAGAFGKVQINKAVSEATVLARELATGSFQARTLGSLLGALGSTLTVGAIAGFFFIRVIDNIAESIKKAAKDAADLEKEFNKNQEALIHMMETARDLTDAVKFGDKVKSEVEKSVEAVEKFKRDSKSGFEATIISISDLLTGDRNPFGLATKQGQEFVKAIQTMQQHIRTLNIEITETNEAIIRWDALTQRVWLGDGVNALQEMQKEVDTLRTKVEEADKARLAHPADPGFLLAYERLVEKLEDANAKLKDLQKEQDQYTAAVEASERTWARVNNAIEQSILAIDKAMKKQMEFDAHAWQRGLDLTQQMKDRAGIARDAGNIEQENADKVKKTYDDTLITAQNLKLASGARVYTDEEAKAKAIEASEAVRVGLRNQLNAQQTEMLRKMDEENAINRATGNEQLTIAEKVKKVREDTIALMEKKGFSPDEIMRQADANAAAAEQHLQTLAGTGAAQSTLNAEMRDYETILQNIRQQQQVTGAQAFIGPDQKDMLLLRQYREEIATVINAMQQQQQRKGGLTDPAEIARANQELQKFSAQYQLLAAKIVTVTHQFQAGLQSWANSFGSTGQQLANTLQQTVGVALQSFNTWITTGKFNLQQLLQSIAQLGLQLVEQLIIQRVVAAINANLAVTQAVASSKIIAAAWASAATAVTIATEGQAAYSAPTAVAIGLAGVTAALGLGSLHEGGPVRRRRRMHGGGLSADEVPIIAQEGEIMIQRSVAQAPGMSDFLLGLNAGRFHGGGGFDPTRSDFEPPSTVAFGGVDSPRMNVFEFLAGGFGKTPFPGAFFPGGPTQIPTFWVDRGPGIGWVPRAVPAAPGGWLSDPSMVKNIGTTRHTPPKSEAHMGGLIRRMHGGGGVGGGGGGGIHIYAFTDLKQLTRHMASRDGQKIIFDTVKGRRIDLGIS